MASTTSPPNLPKLGPERLQFLKAVAPPHLQDIVDKLDEHNESGSDAQSIVIGSALPEVVHSLALTNSIADLSGSHPALTNALVADPDVSSLRDVARNYDAMKHTALVAQGADQNEPPERT